MRKNSYILTAEDVERRIDENTIAVGAVLGTTFTGQMDAIEEINSLLMRVKEQKGWDIPVHVELFLRLSNPTIFMEARGPPKFLILLSLHATLSGPRQSFESHPFTIPSSWLPVR